MKTLEERAKEYAVIAKIRGDMPLELAEEVYIEIATEQKAIDIETIPQLYVRWLMIDGEKPSWKEYAIKATEE